MKTKEKTTLINDGQMTLREIIDLRDGLRKIKGVKSREFSYKVEQNVVAITDALRAVLPQEESIYKIIDPYKEELKRLVDKHRVSLAKESDEQQKKELEKEFETNFALLEDKHEKIRDEFKTKLAELHEMYKSTSSTFKPIKFDLALVPKDILHEHLQFLFPLINK